MPTIRVNNINLFYKEIGQGDAIVLICGFTATHSMWEGVIGEFAKQHRVIIFDNRGVGLSSCPDLPYTIDQMTEDVVALCNALNIESAHFIGNSMGGCIAQNLAYKFPKLTKSTVISNSFPTINCRLKLWLEVGLQLFNVVMPIETRFKNILPQIYSNKFLERPNAVENLIQMMKSNPTPISEPGFRNQMNALLNFNSSNWLQNISCPCLVINADDDLLADIAGGKKMSELIPKSEFYCFKDVGHFPHVEQPEIFNSLVLDFFAARL